jgi:hypothetical protein
MKSEDPDKMPAISDDKTDKKPETDESKMTLKAILLFTLPVIITFLIFCYFFIGSLEKQ